MHELPSKPSAWYMRLSAVQRNALWHIAHFERRPVITTSALLKLDFSRASRACVIMSPDCCLVHRLRVLRHACNACHHNW